MKEDILNESHVFPKEDSRYWHNTLISQFDIHSWLGLLIPIAFDTILLGDIVPIMLTFGEKTLREFPLGVGGEGLRAPFAGHFSNTPKYVSL